MLKSKLLLHLRLLSSDEMNDFVLFAASPYFNTNAALVRLLKYLKDYHPELNSPRLSKSLVYKNIFSENYVYKEKRINDLMSNLYRLFQDFMAFNRFKHSPVPRVMQELSAYREHNMDKSFQKAVIKVKKLSETRIKDEVYHLEQYLLHKEIFKNSSTEKIKQALPSLKAFMNHLDNFFIQEKINIGIIVKNREKAFQESHVILLFNEIKKACKSIAITSEVLVFSEKILSVVEKEELILAKSLCDDFKTIQSQLRHETAQMYLFILLNIFSRKFRAGHTDVLPYIFTLYKFAESKGILLREGKISLATFNNVCVIAVKQNEKEWQKMFFNKYSNFIYPIENRDDAVNLARASVLFEELVTDKESHNIKDVITVINELTFKDKNYVYKVKSQLLRLYFLEFTLTKTSEDLEFLLYFCRAFEKQLKHDTTWNTSRVAVFLKIVSDT